MKKILLMFSALLVFSFLEAQDYYYYYKGSRIPLTMDNTTINLTVTKNFQADFIVGTSIDSCWFTSISADDSTLQGYVMLNDSLSYSEYCYILDSIRTIDGTITVNPSFITSQNVRIGMSPFLYVKLKNPEDLLLLSELADKYHLKIVEQNHFMPLWYTLKCSKQTHENTLQLANHLYESGLFASSVPDFLSNDASCTNDPYFSQLWGLHNQLYSDIDIHFCDAWNFSEGNNVIVAVLDQGIDMLHGDLYENICSISYNSETNTSPSVLYGNHGTHCAGTIGAVGNNNKQVIGVAPKCKLMSISNKLDVTPNSRIRRADGINWAWKHGADVINNSWSSSVQYDVIDDAIDSALTRGRNGKGTVIVFSSGNLDSFVSYPANSNDSIIAVGAISMDGERYDDSNSGNGLSVVAPGVNILSTLPNDTVGFMDGTSMAAAHVSGLAALILSIRLDLTVQDVKNIIEITAQKTGGDSYQTDSSHYNGTWNSQLGYGLIDAHRALAYTYLYGSDFSVYMDTLFSCNHLGFTCSYFDPEIFSSQWVCSSNLMIVEQNGNSVDVIPLAAGEDTVSVQLYSYNRLIHQQDYIFNISNLAQTFLVPVISTSDTITTNSLWSNNNMLLSNDVTIDSLATLTITGTLHCSSSARIIVRPGGKLIVDGGTLTSACAGEMWPGICVEGHTNLPQTAANQGTVQLFNGAVVENALCGILTCNPADSLHTTGGIVTADSATFRSCTRAVYYLPYASVAGSGNVADNKGSFHDCTFTIDDNNLFAANNTDFIEHVRLWDVKGVTFSRCRFEDVRTGVHSRGIAVNAMSAGFTVRTECQGTAGHPYDCACPTTTNSYCSFAGFGTAVSASTSGSPYPVAIDGARFAGNLTGVSISGSSHASVTHCQFDLGETSVRAVTGLSLNGCTGYLVEENTFSRDASAPVCTRRGISVNASGTDVNGLYRNFFERLSYGIFISGTNGNSISIGLQMTCNGFTNNTYDIYVASGATVGPMQGIIGKGADNTFSGTHTSSLYNAGNQRIDYYYSTGTNHAPQNPVGNVTLHTNAGSNNCASTLCNSGGMPSPKSPTPSFLALKQQYEDLQTDFNRNGYADLLATAIPTQAEPPTSPDELAAAQYASQQLNAIATELFAQSHERVRALMADTLEDLRAVMAWLDATPGLTSQYLEVETEFKLSGNNISLTDIVNHVATPEERDEHDNYLMFSILKDALRYDNSHVAWINATDAQIGELVRIADANTGRSSLLAKNVLCFFFGICYDDIETRTLEQNVSDYKVEEHTGASRQNITIHPNPTKDILNIELYGMGNVRGAISVTNMVGVIILSQTCNSTVSQLDVSRLKPGIYMVSFRNETGYVMRKFIKL